MRKTSTVPPKRSFLLFLTLFLGIVLSSCESSSPEVETIPEGPVELIHPWVTATPSEVGMSEEGLNSAEVRARDIPRMKSLIVIKDGRLVHETYLHGAVQDDLFDVRSVTKSIVSTIVGIAIDDGIVPGVNTTISDHLSFLGESFPEEIKAVTFQNLLTMSAGWRWDESIYDASGSYATWLSAPNRERWVLEQPLVNDPGTAFTYNSGSVHILGVLTEQFLNQLIMSFAAANFFAQIGIISQRWEIFNSGYPNGGAGIDLSAKDLARIGQLYLQGGVSGDRRILSQSWIDEATSPKYTWRNTFGSLKALSYGYLWWTDETEGLPAFFAWGFGGQYIYVVPSKNLVVVTTTDFSGLAGDYETRMDLEVAVMNVITQHVVRAVL